MGRRLDETLANAGIGSRADVRKKILSGRVCVNGIPVRKPDARVENGDVLTLDGEEVPAERYVYLAMNKPVGYVSSTVGADSLLVLVPERYRRRDLACAGRLDKDTSGLILLTNDGAFAHRVISPRRHVEKTYVAVLEREITDSDRDRFAAGMTLRDGLRTMPAKLERTDLPDTVRVTVCEGKYHEVRRMFAATGNFVKELKRIAVGSVVLDIAEGEVRCLTEQEIRAF